MAYLCGLMSPDKEKKSGEEDLNTDLETILRAMPSYLDIMIEECVKLVSELKRRETHKRIGCQNVLGILQFS